MVIFSDILSQRESMHSSNESTSLTRIHTIFLNKTRQLPFFILLLFENYHLFEDRKMLLPVKMWFFLLHCHESQIDILYFSIWYKLNANTYHENYDWLVNMWNIQWQGATRQNESIQFRTYNTVWINSMNMNVIFVYGFMSTLLLKKKITTNL